MLYVERTNDGKIIALHKSSDQSGSEQKTLIDKEVMDFLKSNSDQDSWKELLALTDSATIRILEDLIDLLIRKNVISFTELPEQAQERIRERQWIRESMSSQDLLVDNIL